MRHACSKSQSRKTRRLARATERISRQAQTGSDLHGGSFFLSVMVSTRRPTVASRTLAEQLRPVVHAHGAVRETLEVVEKARDDKMDVTLAEQTLAGIDQIASAYGLSSS